MAIAYRLDAISQGPKNENKWNVQKNEYFIDNKTRIIQREAQYLFWIAEPKNNNFDRVLKIYLVFSILFS
jgi:hypothetical protein